MPIPILSRRLIPLRNIGIRFLARRGNYMTNTDAAPGSGITWSSCIFKKKIDPEKPVEVDFTVTNPGTSFVQVQPVGFVAFSNPCE